MKRALTGIVSLAAACASPAAFEPSTIFTEDAERFAALLEHSSLPDASAVQSAYLDPATPGVEIFTPHRIESAQNLAARIAENEARYRHAANVCLPAAQRMTPRATAVLQRIASMLGEEGAPAPVYFLFGAGNSGGTADARGLAIGLEVVCDGKENAAQAEAVLEEFVAHEVVHVYQARAGESEAQVDLLYVALMEGTADFIMRRALDRPTAFGDAREAYGRAHEEELWRAFMADYRPGAWGPNSWFYGPGRDGRPADMGYWIGQRIAEAYYDQAEDKTAALRTLIELRDPAAILARSGYGQSQ